MSITIKCIVFKDEVVLAVNGEDYADLLRGLDVANEYYNDRKLVRATLTAPYGNWASLDKDWLVRLHNIFDLPKWYKDEPVKHENRIKTAMK